MAVRALDQDADVLLDAGPTLVITAPRWHSSLQRQDSQRARDAHRLLFLEVVRLPEWHDRYFLDFTVAIPPVFFCLLRHGMSRDAVDVRMAAREVLRELVYKLLSCGSSRGES